MRPRRTFQSKLDHLFEMLCTAAGSGLPCPSNYTLAEKLDVASPPYVSELMAALVFKKRIVAERKGGNRRVRIVSTGDWTAWTDQSTQRRHAKQINPPKDFRGDLSPARFIVRDPCSYCGIKREVGCRHYPREQVAA